MPRTHARCAFTSQSIFQHDNNHWHNTIHLQFIYLYLVCIISIYCISHSLIIKYSNTAHVWRGLAACMCTILTIYSRSDVFTTTLNITLFVDLNSCIYFSQKRKCFKGSLFHWRVHRMVSLRIRRRRTRLYFSIITFLHYGANMCVWLWCGDDRFAVVFVSSLVLVYFTYYYAWGAQIILRSSPLYVFVLFLCCAFSITYNNNCRKVRQRNVFCYNIMHHDRIRRGRN